jgi:small subunit ribosomal protein S15
VKSKGAFGVWSTGGTVEKSKKPASKKAPSWVELKPQGAIEAIINLANAGHSQSEIGSMMRDQYGVPDVKALTGKGIQEILQENKLLPEIPEDLLNLIKKSVALKTHLERNKKDFTAKRGYQLTVSKIRRLVKYYKGKGRLPKQWRFSDETAALLVK